MTNNHYDFTKEIIKKNRACTRKKGYATSGLAEKVREGVEKKTGKMIYIYCCCYCGQYHLSHKVKDGFIRPKV